MWANGQECLLVGRLVPEIKARDNVLAFIILISVEDL